MTDPTFPIRRWVWWLIMMSMILSIVVNMALGSMVGRALRAGEALLVSYEYLTAADDELKKVVANLQAQINICMDLKTRRADIGRYINVTQSPRQNPRQN